jgi:hypothetical protein
MVLYGLARRRGFVHAKTLWTQACISIEDTEQDLGLIYRMMGRKGLGSIENVGPRLAEVIEGLLNEVLANPVATGG